MSKVYNWFNERLEIQSIADDVTSKYVLAGSLQPIRGI
jgi:cytochrome b6